MVRKEFSFFFVSVHYWYEFEVVLRALDWVLEFLWFNGFPIFVLNYINKKRKKSFIGLRGKDFQ